MAWTYSGDPTKSDLDNYRFLTGDTDSTFPLLQDEEVSFILAQTSDQNQRLYRLFMAICRRLARIPIRTLGPQREDFKDTVAYYKEQVKFYRAQTYGRSVPPTEDADSAFEKGMHDYV